MFEIDIAWLAIFPLAWLGTMAGLLLAIHFRTFIGLWREPALAVPVLIFESDDWGPGPGGDAAALTDIAACLVAFRDSAGHPAVMTLGLVLAIPDGRAILEDRLRTYHRVSLCDPGQRALLEAVRSGCEAGCFAIQRHGMEHVWPEALLARSLTDPALQAWLGQAEARTESLPDELQSRWTNGAALPSRPLSPQAIEAAVREEAKLLERLFGAAPVVAVPNTFLWSETVEAAWCSSGVRCIITCGCRYEARDASGALAPGDVVIRNGDRSSHGATYLVRDEYFEPHLAHRAERIWEAVQRKTALGRPALIETHRRGYCAGAPALAQALDNLTRGIDGTLRRLPQLRFMSSAMLAEHLGDPHSPLLVVDRRRRLAYLLRRLAHDPATRGLLRRSGLGIAFAVLARLLLAVTGDRMVSRAQC